MNRILLLLILFCIGTNLSAQYVYTIKADSVKITNTCDTAELIIENHTQTVPGFLFNKGRGRTEFRRGLFSLDDTTYVIGADTLNINKGLSYLNANNGILRTGNTFQFGNDINNPSGGPATQIRPTFYNQNSQVFNWMAGGSGIFTVSKGFYSTTETNALKGYHIARFAAPGQQGGLVIESYEHQYWTGPLTWIIFKNTDPLGDNSGNFYGDKYAAMIEIGTRQGTDGKSHNNFNFHLPNDTVFQTTNESPLRLFGTYTTTSGTSFRLPTAVVRRLDISEGQGGSGGDPADMPALSRNNPFSRLVVDAKNVPIVMANLPSALNGHFLIVDSVGKVWQGDTTANLSSSQNKVKITTDVTSSSSTVSASGLSFAVNAGTYYKFKFLVVFSSSATSTGIKLGLNTPSATVFSATADISNAADGVGSKYQGSITSSGDVVVSQGVEAANSNYIATVEGIILASASGTLQLTFGSAVDGSQVTIRNGSMGSIENY